MKRSIAVLFILVLVLSAAYAQTEAYDDYNSGRVDWKLLTYLERNTWLGFNYSDEATTIKNYYYDSNFPFHLDSLKTTYSNQGASYSTECYYYSETPEYRQMETLFYHGWYLPSGRSVTRYNDIDRVYYEARYATQSPDAPISNYTEYYYDDAGRKISRLYYAPDNNNPGELSFRSGQYWRYNEQGLLAEVLSYNVSYSPSLYNNSLTIYNYNSAGLVTEKTVANSADTLNWSLSYSIYTTYDMSFGSLKPCQEVYYTYNPDMDSISLYRSSTYTYEDNNRKVNISHTYPQTSGFGQEHYTYNDANLLLTHNTSSYSSNSSSQRQITQIWEAPVTAADDPILQPNTISLKSYPNPFNPTTTISYELPAAGNTMLELFNIRGQKVKTLVNGHQDAGQHNLTLEADSATMASGVYFLRLQSGSKTGSTKLLLMK
jgi:hypothetical protein